MNNWLFFARKTTYANKVTFAQAQKPAFAHCNKPLSELKAILLYMGWDLM